MTMGINFIFAKGTCKHKHKQQKNKKCTKLLTVAASTSMAVTLRLAVKGILRVFMSFCHFEINISRNSWLKGPEYDKKPVHSKTSPTNLHEQKQTNIGFITYLLLRRDTSKLKASNFKMENYNKKRKDSLAFVLTSFNFFVKV